MVHLVIVCTCVVPCCQGLGEWLTRHRRVSRRGGYFSLPSYGARPSFSLPTPEASPREIVQNSAARYTWYSGGIPPSAAGSRLWPWARAPRPLERLSAQLETRKKKPPTAGNNMWAGWRGQPVVSSCRGTTYDARHRPEVTPTHPLPGPRCTLEKLSAPLWERKAPAAVCAKSVASLLHLVTAGATT